MNRIICKSIVLLSFYLGSYCIARGQTKDCAWVEDIKVVIEVESIPNNLSTISLKFNDEFLMDYAVWLKGPDMDNRIYKNKEKEFNNLKAGEYEFIIVDRKGCSKKIEVNVK